MTIETIIIVAIILSAAALAGRRLYKTLARGEGGCASCPDSCGRCPNGPQKKCAENEKSP